MDDPNGYDAVLLRARFINQDREYVFFYECPALSAFTPPVIDELDVYQEFYRRMSEFYRVSDTKGWVLLSITPLSCPEVYRIWWGPGLAGTQPV